MPGFLTHLECTRCFARLNAEELHNLCACGGPLLARYDLDAASRAIDRSSLAHRPSTLWRYRELLPASPNESPVTLGEGFTPLLRSRIGERAGYPQLYIKDESGNPTGSFKARGMSVAVTMALHRGASALSLPSAGNAASAASAYGARAGLPVHVFMPRDTPGIFVTECEALGASVTLVDGVITDAGRSMRQAGEGKGWFDLSTLKEPYRAEGKKTMGYELAEQFAWTLPDVVLYPTGGGTGIVGMWKAFSEMEALGWIGPGRPRMYSIQAAGCAPIVRAFEQGLDAAESFPSPHTFASGLRVPSAIGDALILEALRKSGGGAVAVSDEEIRSAWRKTGPGDGIFMAPEGAAVWAGLEKLVESGCVGKEERIVFFNTGTGLKYAECFSTGGSS